MIRNISITNFKGISETSQIELKPITLLFGPNSSGKSTIIQAIHYAKEIFERKNFDPKETRFGGSALNLGGFKNLVYKHEYDRKMNLQFEFELANTEIPIDPKYNFDINLKNDIHQLIKNWEKNDYYIEDIEARVSSRQDIIHNVEHIHQKSETAYLCIDIEWLSKFHRVEVTKLEFGLDSEVFLKIGIDKFDSNGKLYPKISFINFDHPNIDKFGDPWNELFNNVTNGGLTYDQSLPIDLSNSVIPDWDKGIVLPYDSYRGNIDASDLEDDVIDYLEIICQLAKGLGQLLMLELDKFIYIGPIREIPNRNYESHFEGELERWSNGLAAWDLLLDKKVDFKLLNNWLNKLKIDYQFLHQKDLSKLSIEDLSHVHYLTEENLLASIRSTFESFDENSPLFQSGMEFKIYDLIKEEFEKLNKALYEKLDQNANVVLSDSKKNIEVKPHDVGIGISQVLPIIIAVLTQKNPILAVEQPELHIHPALQVELADLFIYGTYKYPNAIYLIETHSEHFILRLLRRIRNTSKDGDVSQKLKPEKLNIYYIDTEDIFTNIKKITVDERGRFNEKWPKGFFEERIDEIG